MNYSRGEDMNRRGFTLVEVLAVVAILAVLAGIAIPAVYRYVIKGRENYYVGLESSLESNAQDYYSTRLQELPRGQLDSNGNPIYTTKLYLSTLEDLNMVTNKVLDADGGSCANSYIVVTKKDTTTSNEFDYQTCLVCDNYKTDDAVCN